MRLYFQGNNLPCSLKKYVEIEDYWVVARANKRMNNGLKISTRKVVQKNQTEEMSERYVFQLDLFLLSERNV